MENFQKPNLIPQRKAPITTYYCDSPIVEELQQERLQQSRIIARQLDTIGKLKRALDMVMLDRSGRRGSWSPPVLNIPDVLLHHDVEYIDVGVQTDSSSTRSRSQDADYDQVRRALGLLAEENLRLARDRHESEEALMAQKARTNRILTVCTRISSSPGHAGISSPALAKWVSMGLEEVEFPIRDRTETFDDACLHRPARDNGGSTTTRSRSALSEGDAPVDGLDLDMIYGSSFEVTDFNSHHPDAFPLTPKASHKDEIGQLAGSYWTGEEMIFFKNFGPELISESSDLVVRFVDSWTLGLFRSGLAEDITGRVTSVSPRIEIEWISSKKNWVRIDLSSSISGEWWTGYSTIALEPSSHGSGNVEGDWGCRRILIAPTGKAELRARLMPGESPEMIGSVAPKYGGGRLVISWGNGQVWEHMRS